MTITVDTPTATWPLLLPERPRRYGPKSRRLLLRLVVGLTVVQLLGAVMLFGTSDAAWNAAGTSLVFPGVGFLFVASPVLFAVTLVLMLVALVVWWGASAHFAIPLVWLASAVVPALMADGPRVWTDRGITWSWAVIVAYALALTFVGTAVVRTERAFRAKRAQVGDLNEYLRTATFERQPKMAREPDAMDVELLRWCYSFANQPADGLDGLDWGEQFHGGTQLRYQLNTVAWALSLYAANFVPNAQAQCEAALARVVLKHTDLRVWRYWRALNLLGNFDPNPDPIRRDNIMFSAFFGDVLNIYEAATGSTRFDQPGSLPFVWKDGRTFAYDHHSIIDAVADNYRRSSLGFYPCEPGWSFTVCNVMGAQSLFGHDRLHGTDTWQQVKPRWVRTLEDEYLTPDGSYAHIKSSHVGLAWDTGEVPGGHYLAAGSHRFADILPLHALRGALLERRRAQPKMKALAAAVIDGRLEMELPATLERNRAIRSALPAWNQVIGGARLVGEHALAQAALDASARQCSTGQRWPERPLASGMQGFGGHMMVRWSAPMSAADLNTRGYLPPTGPVVVDAPWNDVLIVEARCNGEGALVLRLEPLNGGTPGAMLQMASLTPHATYLVTNEGGNTKLVADHEGRASVTVDVTSPRHVVISEVVTA